MLRGLALSRGMILSLIATLLISACGGGGSGPAPDTTPDAFSVAARADQEPNATVTSSAVIITGINRETPVSVSGGSYSLDGGSTFITEASTLQNNQSLLLRGTAAAAYTTPVTVTLTVGELSADFVITTRAKDITPATFSIAPAANQEPNAEVNSAPITITDIDADVALLVSNGRYSLDNGSSFATEATTINNEQAVIVQGTAPAEFATSETVTLTVGTVSQDFVITTRARDTSPDDLAEFSPVTDGDPSTEYTSNALTIGGIEGAVAISISAGGSFALDDGDTFSTEAATVENGQTVRVRATTANEFAAPVTVTLTVGTETRDFTVTAAPDTTPNALSFSGTSAAQVPGATYTSAELAISGINTAAAIQISGADAQYRINTDGVWGAYTNADGSVSAGNLVQVQATAPATPASSVDIALSVGTLTETLALVTAADSTAPVAAVQFPTPTTMTDGDYVYLRGTASDDYSDITEIRITVTRMEGDTAVPVTSETVTAATGESLTNWTQRVEGIALDTTNTISIVAVDAAGNVQAEPVELNVTQATTPVDFPVGSSLSLETSAVILLDKGADRNRLLFARPSATSFDNLVAIDLGTSQRGGFWNDSITRGQVYFFHSLSQNRVLVSTSYSPTGGSTSGAIIEIDLALGTFVREVTGPTKDTESGFTMGSAGGLDVDSLGIIYAADSTGDRVFSVDANGVRTIVSDANTPPAGEFPFSRPQSIVVDEARNRLLVADSDDRLLYWVSLADGSRSIAIDSESVGAGSPYSLKKDSSAETAFFYVTNPSSALYSVDLASGSLKMISGPVLPEGGANPLTSPYSSIALDELSSLMYVAGPSDGMTTMEVFVVDIASGERVILNRDIGEPIVPE